MDNDDDQTVMLTVRLPATLRYKLKIAAALEERSINSIAVELLEFWVRGWEQNKPWTQSEDSAQDTPADSSPRSS